MPRTGQPLPPGRANDSRRLPRSKNACPTVPSGAVTLAIPSITTITPHLTGVHQHEQFEYGLDTLLTGLHTTTPPTAPHTGPN